MADSGEGRLEEPTTDERRIHVECGLCNVVSDYVC